MKLCIIKKIIIFKFSILSHIGFYLPPKIDLINLLGVPWVKSGEMRAGTRTRVVTKT
jgi:hypothetical protein